MVNPLRKSRCSSFAERLRCPPTQKIREQQGMGPWFMEEKGLTNLNLPLEGEGLQSGSKGDPDDERQEHSFMREWEGKT